MRTIIALGAALLSFVLLQGTASAAGNTTQSGSTLAAGGTINFNGFIAGPSFGNLVGPGLGCASGTEPNCEFVTFTATDTGTVTLTLNSTSPDLFGPQVIDFQVDCNGDVRAMGSTDPVTGTATITFPVNAGETCTLRLTTQFGSLNDIDFNGKLSLVAETVTFTNGFVTGGGQVLNPNTSFTSNAKPAKNGFQGTVRYFNNSSNCKFQSTVIDSLVTTTTTDSFGNTFKTAVITGHGRVNLGSGWVDDPAEFHAKAEDHGQTGDRFAIDKCGSVDAPIASGQIVIHDK